MSQNHTRLIPIQPVQTDHILMAREESEMKVIKPVPDGEDALEKTESCTPDPLPYVWSLGNIGFNILANYRGELS